VAQVRPVSSRVPGTGAATEVASNGAVPKAYSSTLGAPSPSASSFGPSRAEAPALLGAAAERTGGEWHSSLLGSASVLKAFTKIFQDFRQSYVLRYTPENVPAPGWHALQVQVPSVRGATIHARAGYYGAD